MCLRSGVFRLSFIRFRKGERLSQPEIGVTADLSRMDFTRDDTAAGATRPVHNTTLADDEDCRLKDTYEELLNSGYLVGIRDYLAGPRLKRFA